jgi:hypothetical protein
VASAAAEHLHLREKAVEAAVQAGLDAESDAERADIGRWLAGLVHPARVVTLDMLARAVGAFLAVFDDLVTDVPRAAAYFAAMLKPLADAEVVAALELLPPTVAAALGLAPAPDADKPAAATAPAGDDTAAKQAPAPAPAPAPAAAPAAAAAAPAAGAAPAPAAADAPAAAPADDGFTEAKKGKKKKAMVFEE